MSDTKPDDYALTDEDMAHQVPVGLCEELRIEAAVVPHRRGKLYALAANEIERLERELAEARARLNMAPSDMTPFPDEKLIEMLEAAAQAWAADVYLRNKEQFDSGLYHSPPQHTDSIMWHAAQRLRALTNAPHQSGPTDQPACKKCGAPATVFDMPFGYFCQRHIPPGYVAPSPRAG